MSLTAVIKKEFLDSIRSRMLLALTLLFVLFAGGLTAIRFVPPIFATSTVETSTLALLNSMKTPTVFFVPLIGLVIGYKSIVGERESGSLKLMLSLPNTRREVVFGKFIGRTAVLAVSILLGYAVAGVIALLSYDSFAFSIFGTYTLLTIFYGVVFIAIATGISAGVKSSWWAVSVAGVMYALFLFVWDIIVVIFIVATVGWTTPETGPPGSIQALFMLNPSTAFGYATRAVIPEFDEIVILVEPTEFYLQDWVGFVILALWIVVPFGLGYLRFTRTEL